VDIFLIQDHFACEPALNWGGEFTYVRTFVPGDEARQLRTRLADLQAMAEASDLQALAVVRRWWTDLGRLASYMGFLHESGVELGVQLLSAEC